MIGSFKDIENIFSELVKDDGVLINSTPTSIDILFKQDLNMLLLLIMN